MSNEHNASQYLRQRDRATDIVDRMEEVRMGNNSLWMDYVRLAFEVAPERAKAIARQIEEKDAEIRRLWQELGRP